MRARPNKQKPKRSHQPAAPRDSITVPAWLITSLTEEFPTGVEATAWSARRSKSHADAFIVTATIRGDDVVGAEQASWLTDRLKTPGQVTALDDLAERLTKLPRQTEIGRSSRSKSDQHGDRANRRPDQTSGKGNPVHAGHVRTTGGS